MKKSLKSTIKGHVGVSSEVGFTNSREIESVSKPASSHKDRANTKAYVPSDSLEKLREQCKGLRKIDRIPYAKPKGSSRNFANDSSVRGADRPAGLGANRGKLKKTLGDINLQKVIAGEGPVSAEAHYINGVERFQMDLPGSAIVHFQKAMDCGKSKVTCLLMIALCHIKKENYSEAIVYLEAGLSEEGISETESIALKYQLNQCLDFLGSMDGLNRNHRRDHHPGPLNLRSAEEAIVSGPRGAALPVQSRSMDSPLHLPKKTDPPVIYEALENRERTGVVWIALSVVAVGTLVLFSLFMKSREPTFHSEFAASRSDSLTASESASASASSDQLPQSESVLPIGKGKQVPEQAAEETNGIQSPRQDLPLTATVGTKKIYIASGAPVLVVTGTLSNYSVADQFGVIVEGEILDSEGTVLSSAAAPCGVIHDEELIRAIHPSTVKSTYLKDGNLQECAVKGGGKKAYQLIFSKTPENLGENYAVAVEAKSHPR